jgi:hypothetical protein
MFAPSNASISSPLDRRDGDPGETSHRAPARPDFAFTDRIHLFALTGGGALPTFPETATLASTAHRVRSAQFGRYTA